MQYLLAVTKIVKDILFFWIRLSLSELTRDDSSGFSVGLEDDSAFFRSSCCLLCILYSLLCRWRVCFEGPSNTLYEGGLFTAILIFPKDFPNNPPDMKFETEMWHPNGESSTKIAFVVF